MTGTRYTVFAALAIMLTMGCGTRTKDDHQFVIAENADVDRSSAPGTDDATPDGARSATGSQLRSNQIRTRHLMDGAVTAGKLGYKAVTVTVAMGAASGVSSADATLAGGVLVGCHPNGNQDQFVDAVALNATTGVITVTLAANATAANSFRCIVLKANAQGVT